MVKRFSIFMIHLKSTKKVKNGQKNILTSFRVHAAPKAGRNTQQANFGESHLLPSGSIKLSMSFSSSPRASLSIHSTFFIEEILSTGAHKVDTKHCARTSTIVIFILFDFLPTVVISFVVLFEYGRTVPMS